MLAIVPVSPDDRETFADLMALSVEMAEEMALVPVNPELAALKVYAAIQAGMAWVAVREGVIVGSLGLKEVPWDYADGTFLLDSWVYVARDERFGDVGVKLLRTAKDYALKRELACFIGVMNPGRRTKKTDLGLYFEIAGYLPFGHLSRIA